MTEKDPAADRLEQLVDQFDALWQQGSGPKWNEWLRQAGSAEEQIKLARLLVPIELEYRRQRGETIEPERDYPEANAEQLALVRELLTPSLHEDATRAPNRAAAKVNSSKDLASQTIGPYKLLQKLGEGGMGEVWMAEQKEPVKRRVALKLIKTGLDNKQVIARFEAERQALAMMDHPNIARVLDAGTTPQGQPYFVMELVQGIPFNSYCDQHKLSIDQRLRLFIPVCQAIQHAHQKGIIHRDLKPSNVLVSLYDGQPVPKVIDFGLAKALQPTTHLTDKTMFTEFGQVVGTLQYMSPEQAEMNQLDVDTRSDIYSLGVMLYELLTGSTPIDQETMRRQAVLQVLHAIREQEPPRPSARLSSSTQEAVSGISSQRQIDPTKLKNILRGELDWIVMRALEKDRTRRYETASGFAEDIQRYLEGDPVQARPPSAGYRLSKYVRRNKGLVASLASIAALLIGGIIGTSWFAIEANRARVDADKARETADEKTAEVVAEKEKVVEQKQFAEAAELKAKAEADNARQAKLATEVALEKSEATLARSNYFLANARWNEGRAEEAQNLLKRVPQRYRNFEWLYSQREFEGSDITLYGHSSSTFSLGFSPDGTRIVSGSRDQTLKLWDAASGEELKTLKGHSGFVSSVSFSPDGKRIVSGSYDQTIKLWDAASGEELKTLAGHAGNVYCVAFSPDGKRIVSSSGDSTLRFWDAASGEQLKTLAGHTSNVRSVAFSPDGTRIVSGSDDRTLKLWDATSGEELKTLAGHADSVSSVAFSPDGQRIVSGSWDQTLKLWDAASGEELKTFSGHTYYIFCVAFSPDGTRIVSGSGDCTLKLWDATSGEQLETLAGHAEFVFSVTFSLDGTRIVSGGGDYTLKFWDVASGGEQLKTLAGHKAEVTSVAFSSDRIRIVSGSADNTLKLWDAVSGQELKTLGGHTDYVTCVAFSPDGRRIVSGSRDKTLKLWDAASGEELKTLAGHTALVRSVVFSLDGTRIVSGSLDKTLKLWDAASGEELRTLTGHTNYVSSVAFSPDGTRIVSGSYDQNLKLWDAVSGVELKTLAGHAGYVYGVAFSPDGTRIVSGSTDKTLKLWDAASGESLKTLAGHSNEVTSVAYSPDGMRIVSGSTDHSLKLWDAASGEELKTIYGRTGIVSSVTFSPDGTRIVSGNYDTTLRLWDAPSGEEIKILTGHSVFVSSVAFSPEGKRIVSGSWDRSVKLWDAATGEELQTLKGHKGLVSRVAFSLDGKRLISQDQDGEEIEWDAGTGELLKHGKAGKEPAPKNLSPDGKYLAIGIVDDVVLVDLEYAKSPREQARRKRSARLKPHRHQEQATAAESREDWYAATFHRAWAVKGKPDSAADREALKADFAKLKEKSPEQAEWLSKLLPNEEVK